MQDEFRQRMLAYIATLDRAIAADERLADGLAAMADAIKDDPSQSDLHVAMLQDVQRHRVNASQWRVQLAAVKEGYEE